MLNAGIGGARIHDVLGFLDKALSGAVAKNIILLVGLNDANTAQPRSNTIEADYNELVHRASLFSKIYVATVGPVSPHRPVGTVYDRAIIGEINRTIRNITSVHGATLIDMNAALSGDDDNLPLGKTTDGVHLSANGYIFWRDALRKAVCAAAPGK